VTADRSVSESPARRCGGHEGLASSLERLAGWGVVLLVAVTLGTLAARPFWPVAASMLSGPPAQLAGLVLCLALPAVYGRGARRRSDGPAGHPQRSTLLAQGLVAPFYLVVALGLGGSAVVAWIAHEPGRLLPGWAARGALAIAFLALAASALVAALPKRDRSPPEGSGRGAFGADPGD
jgi:hypothetical protein